MINLISHIHAKGEKERGVLIFLIREQIISSINRSQKKAEITIAAKKSWPEGEMIKLDEGEFAGYYTITSQSHRGAYMIHAKKS